MSFIMYGSYGYTGSLIAQEAVMRGLRPILAGRDARRLRAQAEALDLEWRAVSLDDARGLQALLRAAPLVLHCAGPYARTAAPMVAACLRAATHYLDLTGEVAVFQALHALDEHAAASGITILPGVGFDVVPTDCLAAHLKARLPGATQLSLAVQGVTGVTRGTARTMAAAAARGGLILRNGQLTPVPAAWRTRYIDIAAGQPVEAVSLPLADVLAAYYSTGIPNIVAYGSGPTHQRAALRATRHLGGLLRLAPAQAAAAGLIRLLNPRPSAEQRGSARAHVWGEVVDGRGGSAVARLETPEVYALTVQSALECVQRVLSGATPGARPSAGGGVPAGFATPAMAFGPGLLDALPGVVLSDA